MNEKAKDKSGEDTTEAAAKESTEESAEKSTEESVEASAEETAEESAEESAEEPAEESAEESAEEQAEEPIEASAEETAAEPIEASAEETAEEQAEEQAEDSADEPAEELAEELAEEQAEEQAKPSPDEETAGEDQHVVRGTVKWFNAEKGFGFIVADDGSGDVFLHLSALRQAGLESVSGGATIVCAVSRGPKGLQVDRVDEVDESTASPVVRRRPRSPLGYDRPRHEPLTEVGEFVAATVKWFNPNKGFGFITVDEDSPDVFVHMQTLRRCGLTTLDSGQEVRVRIGQSAKGPQVSDIDAS